MNCDVLVVGAGALGLSSAYHIKRKNPGKRVTVIERERAAGLGNSLRNEGGFRNFFSSETNYQLSDSTIDWFTYLESVLNYDLKLENIGYLWLLSKDQWSQYKSVIKDITRRGILTRVIQRDELKNMIPQTVIDFSRDREAEKLGLESPEIGILAEKAGSIDSQALIKSYEREFIKLGGEIFYNTGAEKILLEPIKTLGLEAEPFVWQDTEVKGVLTSVGEIRCGMTVLATGVWSGELLHPLGVDSFMRPKKKADLCFKK